MNDKHYNPAIAARLRTLVDGRQWLSIPDYLGTLSNAQFRTAGYMLGEVFMPKLPTDDFWALADVLVTYNSKAFLVTVLKSWISTHPAPCSLTPVPSFFASLRGHAEDVRKALFVLLPVLSSPSEIEGLLQVMDVRDAQVRINAYLHSITPATAFLLLRTLHEVEDDRALLVRITYFLMKMGDNLSFNLASAIRSFFGLEEVKGTFSLRLQPYQLSHVIADFDAFKKVVKI